MRKIYLAWLVVLLLCAGCQPADPQAELDKAAKILNQDMPKSIDASTSFIEVKSGDMEIIYVCEFKDVSDDYVRQSKAILKQNAEASLKGSKNGLAYFIEHKIPMTYIYRNTKGEEVMSYSIHPWEL